MLLHGSRRLSNQKVPDAINLMTRANVGVGAIERAGDAAALLKCVRYIVCAPRGSVETAGCGCGGRHTWWFLWASPASYAVLRPKNIPLI